MPLKLTIPGLHQVCIVCGEKLKLTNFSECRECGTVYDAPRIVKASEEFEEHVILKPCPKCGSNRYRQIMVAACSGCGHKRPKVCPSCSNEYYKRFRKDKGAYVTFCPWCNGAVDDLMRAARLPLEFQSSVLYGLRSNEVNPPLISFLSAVTGETLIAPPQRWLVLFGPTGVGKTAFACAYANHLMLWQIPVRFMDFPEFMESLRGAMFDFKGECSRRIREDYQRMKDSQVLIIDNLREQHYTDFFKIKLHQLVCHRQSKRLVTVFTTQYDPDGLGRTFDADTVSRIMKMSGQWFVPGLRDMRTAARQEHEARL